MKEIINTILLEWQDRELPETKERDITLDNYLNTGHAIVVKGFRRVGKTFLFYNLIKKLLKDHSKKDVIYFNFEDERIPLKTEFLTSLLPAIKEFNGQSPLIFFSMKSRLSRDGAAGSGESWIRKILRFSSPALLPKCLKEKFPRNFAVDTWELNYFLYPSRNS